MLQKVKSILFILILGSLSTAVLLWFKDYTAPKIEEYQAYRLKSAILDACEIKHGKADYEALFEKNLKSHKLNDIDCFVNNKGDFIVEFNGRGLWGPIEGVMSLKPDLKTIENIRIISQEETPGLGGRIAEDEYLAKFKKSIVDPVLKLCVQKKALNENEIDAISGATISSAIFVACINDTVKSVRGKI